MQKTKTPQWTAKAPEGVRSWDRIRLYANEADYRAVGWPPLGPYWCSGYGEGYAVVVAYVPHGTSDAEIRKFWPEAKIIDRMQEDIDMVFSDRFSKPDWWTN